MAVRFTADSTVMDVALDSARANGVPLTLDVSISPGQILVTHPNVSVRVHPHAASLTLRENGRGAATFSNYQKARS